MSKLFAVCFDAAEWGQVEALLDQGRMPVLAELRAGGAAGTLSRPAAYRAEAVYPSLLAGAEPDDIGYWGPVQFDPATYESYERGTYLGRPFYAGRDFRSVVFDFPQAHIAADVEGVQVLAWGAHSPLYPAASRPAGLFTEIVRRFGVHPGARSDGFGGWHNSAYSDALGRAMVEGARRRGEIARWLASTRDWDLFLTSFSESHSGGHQFWFGVDPRHPLHHQPAAPAARARLEAIYEAMDAALGRAIGDIDDDTTVMVFAAHGTQPNSGDVVGQVLLPELLCRLQTGERLLDLERDAAADVTLPSRRHHAIEHLRRRVVKLPGRPTLQQRVRHGAPPEVLRMGARAAEFARTRTVRPPWWRMDLREPRERLIDPATYREPHFARAHVPTWYRAFWPQMRWFVIPAFSDAHVRLNVVGREAQGVVAPDRFREEVALLEEVLRACTDARTGEPLIEDFDCVRGDDPFARPGLDADVAVSFRCPTDRIAHPEVGVVGPSPYMRSGEHSRNGWAVINGPGISPGSTFAGSASDLTATMLTLLGESADASHGLPLVRPHAPDGPGRGSEGTD